jgi:threonine synthase
MVTILPCRYTGDEIPEADLRSLMQRSYQTFEDQDNPVPTKRVGDLQIMELFHGPTYAFKDVALQALGNLFEYFLKRKQKRITVVGATSGDTGSAAIYGLRGKENVECFILFPEGRVSPIQQLQMTSVTDDNVHCIAVQVLLVRSRGLSKMLACKIRTYLERGHSRQPINHVK